MSVRVSFSRPSRAGFPIVESALMLLLTVGCTLQRYQPAPLDPDASAQRFESRTTDAPALKQYILEHGHPASDWPVQRWSLADLTLLANDGIGMSAWSYRSQYSWGIA